MAQYIFKNGKFEKDITKLGRKAFTMYNGAVIVLNGCYFDNLQKRYCGTRRDGVEVRLAPSSIVSVKAVV